MSEPTADITQITAPNSIYFSANSDRAWLWMREHYGRHSIYFNLPVDQSNVSAFEQAVKARNFSIHVLQTHPAEGR
jgi:hypothetical protein